MKICEEMIKLRDWLDEKGIAWHDVSTISADFTIHRTHFNFKGYEVSVINGYGSYGGYDRHDKINHGALEMMIDDREPIGWLSAENVIQKLEELK